MLEDSQLQLAQGIAQEIERIPARIQESMQARHSRQALGKLVEFWSGYIEAFYTLGFISRERGDKLLNELTEQENAAVRKLCHITTWGAT